MDRLNSDLIIGISKFLDPLSISHFACSNSQFNSSCQSDSLWKFLICTHFGWESCQSLEPVISRSTTSFSNWLTIYKLYSQSVYIAVHFTNSEPEQILKIFPTKVQAAQHLFEIFSGHVRSMIGFDEADLTGLNSDFLDTEYVRYHYIFNQRTRILKDHGYPPRKTDFLAKNPSFKDQLVQLKQRLNEKAIRLLCSNETLHDWSDNKYEIQTETMFTKIGKVF